MAEYHLRIKELPASEQPRERLRDYGAAALSDAELLVKSVKRGQLVVIPNGSHASYMSDPGLFNQELIRFVGMCAQENGE